MRNVYGDPAHAQVRERLHKRLTELRAHYGDSDEKDQAFLKSYLGLRKEVLERRRK